MFSFPQTRMLREAELGRRRPFTAIQLIGLFFLVLLGSTTVQSLILSPAQVAAILSHPDFSTIINDGSLTMAAKVDALMNIALPDWVMAVQLFSTAAMVIGCILFCRYVEKRSLVSMGFVKKGAVPEYLFGLFIGFLMLFSALGLCTLSGQISMPWQYGHYSLKYAPWASIMIFFAGYLIQGLSEELLCRSFLMVSLSRGHKPWICILANSLLFSALHLFNKGITPLAFLNLTLFGIFASIYTLRRGSIWGIAAIHSMWNFTQGNVFGISVSGMNRAPSLFYVDLSRFPSWFGGGSFGLEGGVTVTAVLMISIAIVWMTPTKPCELARE